MPKAYRIKRYNNVTPTKRRRLLEENLVPISDEDIVNNLDIQDYLNKGDWLIEYRDNNSSAYIYKVKEYRHKPRLHLYIKHFVEIENIFRLDASRFDDESHKLLKETEHLDNLPMYFCTKFDEYQAKVDIDPEEKVRHLIFMLELKRNLLNSEGQALLHKLDTGELSPARIKAMINRSLQSNPLVHMTKIATIPNERNLIDPTKISGAISRAILESYIKSHNGQLPTIKEFQKLTNKFKAAGTRRPRANKEPSKTQAKKIAVKKIVVKTKWKKIKIKKHSKRH